MKPRHQDDLERRWQPPWRRWLRLKASKATSLCVRCTSVRISQIKLETNGSFYTRSIRDMIKDAASTQSNCALCSFLTSHISLKFANEFIKMKDYNVIVSLRPSRTAEDILTSPKGQNQMEVKIGNSQPSLFFDICKLGLEPAGDDLGVFNGRYPQTYVEEPRSSGSMYLPRIVNSNPLSEATVGMVKDWLLACRSHQLCKSQVPRPLPTRVIDVRSENPKIIETSGLNGLYITLSHRWGLFKDNFSTTIENIDQRKSLGLEMSKLPLNFRDAINFTRHLGYDYIWIDSLCILQQQEDLRDWRHEAGRMAGYYNNAVATLTIADASDCQTGFLHHRYQSHSPVIPGDKDELYCLREPLSGEYHLDTFSSISTRAWTLQERILSPRVISFIQDQVLWHCREDIWAEGYLYNDFHAKGGFLCSRAGKLVDRGEDDTFWQEIWYNCVSEFSTRSLTCDSDKFAAIAGLAKMFPQPELGKYVAGIWEHDLFRGLAWNRVENSSWTANQTEIDRSYIAVKAAKHLGAGDYQKPSEYRAPSWSWASVNGPVKVDDLILKNTSGDTTSERKEFEYWDTHYKPHLISSHLIHSDNDSYINILEGSFIKVQGSFRKLWLSKVKPPLKADGFRDLRIKNVIFDEAPAKLTYASLSQPDQANQVWKELLMFQLCKKEVGLVCGLLLEKMRDPNCFKRVGLVDIMYYRVSPENNKADSVSKEWLSESWIEGALCLF